MRRTVLAPTLTSRRVVLGAAWLAVAGCGDGAETGATGPGTPAFYHEQSWDAVRARAVGHLAAQGRDLARARALAGDWQGCAARYREAAVEVGAVPMAEPDPVRIRDAFATALRRDAEWCGALADGQDPPVPPTPLAGLFARRAAAERAGRAFDAGPAPTAPLVTRSDDPAQRTAVRAALTEAWADSVDPRAPTDPWGYWEPAEVLRVHARLGGAAEAAEPWAITADDLATPPTADTYVDSAGLPGSKARVPPGVGVPGDGERALAARLSAAKPTEVQAIVDAGIAELDRSGQPDAERRVHGLRNAVLRRLARAQEWAVAARLVHTMRTPRAFDRDCIDRAGVVAGIEGRLLLRAGDPAAEAVLEEARGESRRFLAGLP